MVRFLGRDNSEEVEGCAECDDAVVDAFAAAMKAKMATARAKGRSGWQTCPEDYLVNMLRGHVEKGDMRDVANIAMMIWHNERAALEAASREGKS